MTSGEADRTGRRERAVPPAGTGHEPLRDAVAVLGAGRGMGFPVTQRIARAGIEVTGWDADAAWREDGGLDEGAARDEGAGDGHRRARADQLAASGANVADTANEAVRDAGIVLTLIADPGELFRLMTGGVLDVMSKTRTPDHAIWLQMASIGAEATQRCVRAAGKQGVGFVDAPVIGTEQHAGQGRLIVIESGPEEARPRVQPLFDAIGCRTVRAGQAGASSRRQESR